MAVLLDIRNLTIQFPRVGRPRVGRAFLPANQQVAPQATFTAVRDITFSANTLYASMLPPPHVAFDRASTHLYHPST